MPSDEGRPPRGDRPQRDRSARSRPPREQTREQTRGREGQPARRAERPTATSPQNNSQLGVILVLAAVVLGVFLLAKGDSDETTTAPQTTASVSNPDDTDDLVENPDTTEATPSTLAPADLRVIAANGTSTKGKAGATAEALNALGYANVLPVDGQDTPLTQVYFVIGSEPDANAVAAALGLESTVVNPMPAVTPLDPEGTSVGEATVLVLIGDDLDPATIGQ